MRHDHPGEHAGDQQHEQDYRQPDAEGQRLHQAGAPAAVAHQAHQPDRQARQHGEQGKHDQQLDGQRRLHGFTIDVLPLLLLVAAALVFARLGVWQLHRADEAAALQDKIEAHARAAPLVLDRAAAAGDLALLQWRRVEARGIWEATRQVLLDNQVSQGQAGYFVYTPLQLPGCGCAVLVNRGWVGGGAIRAAVPDIAIAPGAAILHGVTAPFPATGFGAKTVEAEPVAPGVLRVQRIDPEELSRQLDLRVLPVAILLDPAERDGYRRDWHPPPPRADRHVAYAVQWFLFALIALGIALVQAVRWLDRNRRCAST